MLMNSFVTSPPKKRVFGPSSSFEGPSSTPQLLSIFEAGPSASKKRFLDFPTVGDQDELKVPSICRNEESPDDFWSTILKDESFESFESLMNQCVGSFSVDDQSSETPMNVPGLMFPPADQEDIDSFFGNDQSSSLEPDIDAPCLNQEEMDFIFDSSVLAMNAHDMDFPMLEAGQCAFYSHRRAPKGDYFQATINGNQVDIGHVMGYELTALAKYYIWLPAPENFLFSGPFTIEVAPKNTKGKIAESQVLRGEFQNMISSQQHPSSMSEWGIFAPLPLHLENESKYFHPAERSSDDRPRKGATNAVVTITYCLWCWKKEIRMKPKVVAEKSGKRARTEISGNQT